MKAKKIIELIGTGRNNLKEVNLSVVDRIENAENRSMAAHVMVGAFDAILNSSKRDSDKVRECLDYMNIYKDKWDIKL